MKKKSILFISLDENLFVDSSETFKRQQLISEAFKKITFIVYTKKFKKTVQVGNITLIPTNSKNSFLTFIKSINIFFSLRKEKYDSLSTQDPFFFGFIGLIGSILLRAKFKPQVHTDIFNKNWKKESFLNYFFSIFSNFIFLMAYSIRVVNPNVKLKLDKQNKKVFLIPVFIDSNKYYNTSTIKRYDLLFVGRFVHEKNLFFLLDLFNNLLNTYDSKLTLALVGDGLLCSELKTKVKKLGIYNSVFFLGKKNQFELNDIYSESKLLLFPSLYEGWGLVALEASLCGIPVIMSNTGCAEKVIINNKSGVVCEIDNLEQFIEGVKKLLENDQLRLEYSLNAKNIIYSDFDKDLLIRKWVNFLDE